VTKARAKPPVAPPAPVPVEPPAPAAVIADTVPADVIALLVGTPGSGRSSLLAEWAAAIATGTEWNGHPVERRRVVYLDAAREQRDVADTIEAAAGTEVPTDWLRVLPGRVSLAGDDLGRWCETIRAFGPGLVVLDELGDLGRPSGGIDHPTWAAAVSTFAQGLYDATAPGGAVVLAHDCDVRGKPAGAPLGDGVDVVFRLDRVGGRHSLRTVGPVRTARHRTVVPTPAPELEPMPPRGNWVAGQWAGGYSPV
jgi:AAA domain